MIQSMIRIEGTIKTKDVLIVSFGGLESVMAGIPPFEFLRTLNKSIPEHDKVFFIDSHQAWYHKGFEGHTEDIPSTVGFLRELIAPYKKVLFLGNSAGGYASILFGSLLRIQYILAFVPQTYLRDEWYKGFDPAFTEISKYLNDVSQYVLYGQTGKSKELDPMHHISHCENINNRGNVRLIAQPSLNLKGWSKDGTLGKIISEQIA